MIDTFAVSEKDLGERLDTFLSRHLPDHSRSYFQQLINRNCVLLNGHRVKKQHKVQPGDRVEVTFHHLPKLGVYPEDIPLNILYEDDHAILIDKPAGMVVHPAPGSPSGTLANALLHHCHQLNPQDFDHLRPGIVHRLDKDTSGVLIAAKTPDAHRLLTRQFSQRGVEKTYLVICCGVPKEGRFSGPMMRHRIHRKTMTLGPEGKEAISFFKVLAQRKGLCLVEAKIKTGRTHQIRVHLKEMRCPIVGDPIYGSPRLNRRYGAKRQMLHARMLRLTHPHSQMSLEATAPIPHDLKKFIDFIKCT